MQELSLVVVFGVYTSVVDLINRQNLYYNFIFGNGMSLDER